ncbi:hypothetical protein ACFV1L_06210 [Kitasatospora sp. NPDC059646]|uniref:hypothetical protein n=1 Tax=Kitasatospora sp. NPDC059646 TaxID=3346893 RepID=UPI00369220C7
MAYPDPFDQTSPWGEPPAALTDTTNPTREPFVIGFTLKADAGFAGEWLTPRVYGATAEEAARRGAELLTAMKAEGLIDLTSRAAEYTRSQYKGSGTAASNSAPKRFEGGKVVKAQTAGPGDDDCPHGRTPREGDTWAALFCSARSKAEQCPPLWRQKDGSYKAN